MVVFDPNKLHIQQEKSFKLLLQTVSLTTLILTVPVGLLYLRHGKIRGGYAKKDMIVEGERRQKIMRRA